MVATDAVTLGFAMWISDDLATGLHQCVRGEHSAQRRVLHGTLHLPAPSGHPGALPAARRAHLRRTVREALLDGVERAQGIPPTVCRNPPQSAVILRLKHDPFTAPQAHSDAEHPMPTYFRFLTLLALHIFVAERVEVVVLEVGLGGRWDATNVVPAPAVCGITSLGYDHMELLGYTLREIAGEKAGIMKPSVPCFTSPQEPEVRTALLLCAEWVGRWFESRVERAKGSSTGAEINPRALQPNYTWWLLTRDWSWRLDCARGAGDGVAGAARGGGADSAADGAAGRVPTRRRAPGTSFCVSLLFDTT